MYLWIVEYPKKVEHDIHMFLQIIMNFQCSQSVPPMHRNESSVDSDGDLELQQKRNNHFGLNTIDECQHMQIAPSMYRYNAMLTSV